MPWNDNKGGGGGWNPGGGGRGPWGQGPNGGGRGTGAQHQAARSRRAVQAGARVDERGCFPKQSPGGVVVAIGGAVLSRHVDFHRHLVIAAGRAGHRFAVRRIRRHDWDRDFTFACRIRSKPCCAPTSSKRNQINVGFRTDGDNNAATADADIPPESMMLTGDENIVDIDFTVFWKVAERRATICFKSTTSKTRSKRSPKARCARPSGRAKIDPIQTEGRAEIQEKVRKTMQGTLDSYKAGVTITRVALAESRPAEPSHRRVQRRSGCARRPGQEAQRSATLCQYDRAAGARRSGQNRAGRRSLQADKPSRRRRARRSAFFRSSISIGIRREVTRERHVHRNDAARARQYEQDHHRKQERRWCSICRCRN